MCGRREPPCGFSGQQLKKPAAARKCRQCTGACASQASPLAPTASAMHVHVSCLATFAATKCAGSDTDANSLPWGVCDVCRHEMKGDIIISLLEIAFARASDAMQSFLTLNVLSKAYIGSAFCYRPLQRTAETSEARCNFRHHHGARAEADSGGELA